MQVNRIGNIGFGAAVDSNTRDILLELRNKNVDTSRAEKLMKEIYADRYIMTQTNDGVDYRIAIYSTQGSKAKLKQNIIARFDINKLVKSPKLFNKLLVSKLERIKAERTKQRVNIDEMENNLGRWSQDSYDVEY